MDMPNTIWAVQHEVIGAVRIGEWADTVRHLGGKKYVGADTFEHWRHEVGKLHSQLDRQKAENERLREALELAKAQAEATPLHPFCAMVIITCADALKPEEP